MRRIYFQTKVFISAAKNFVKNVFWYKDFLIHDREWDNDYLLLVTKRKLQKTMRHYQNGLYLPYEGWEEDLKNIEQAYQLAGIIEDNDCWLVEQLFTPEEMNEMVSEYFDILKNYRKWWD